MFVTMVEGTIALESEQAMRDAWAAGTSVDALPPGFIESSLVRSESGVWRIVTVWESPEAVAAMRAQGGPAAVSMFEEAGAEPSVSMWTVEGRVSAR
jgi:heme-degrading monooxygenase HmoA